MSIFATLLTGVHVIISVLLVVVILLQSSKGGGLSGTFGGQASTAIFGTRGTASALATVTKYLAVFFLLFSLVLSLLAGRGLVTESVTQRVLESSPAAQLPAIDDIQLEPGVASDEALVSPIGEDSEEPVQP